MKKLYSMSLQKQLLLIVLVAALPAAGIIVYSGIRLRSEALNDARKETQKLVDRIVTEQQNLVIGAEQLMTAVAQLPDVKRHDAGRVGPILRELSKLNPMYSNIFIADNDGTVWASAIPVSHAFNIADRRYFRNALASGQLSAGEYVISRATSRPTINFAYPIKGDRGNTVGVICIGFSLDRYRPLLERMQLPVGTSFVLIDHAGIILGRGINPEQYIGKTYTPDAFKALREGPETGSSVRKGLTGDERIISYRKVFLKGERVPYLYVTSGVPIDVALKPANKMLLFNVTLFMSFLVGAFILAWLIGKRSIVDRVILLEKASRQLAEGNPAVRASELVAGGELGRLGQTFDVMARQVADREAALRKSEQFLATIIETEPACVKLLAADGSLAMMNRAGLDMIQAESFEQVNGKSIYSLVDPEYQESFRSMLTDVFAGNPCHLEFRITGIKGRQLWLETHSVPLKNDSGDIVSLLGITINISDRKALDRLKGEMISAVSHEMRTPLTAMLGYIEFILENNVDETQTREYLGIVYKETERLNELISNFLDMQRLKEKSGMGSFRPVALEPLLEETATLFGGVAAKYRITMNVVEALPLVLGNEEDILTLLKNLVSNAVKYSPQGGAIVIGARHEGDSITLWVKDEGIGISQEEQGRIFDRFYRVDNTACRTAGGTGLGLALVKEIAHEHGGQVWVESAVGKGSTFFASLPVAS